MLCIAGCSAFDRTPATLDDALIRTAVRNRLLDDGFNDIGIEVSHGIALMLQGGVRFRVDRRLSIISDVRYGPAPSTIEVFSLQQQGEGMQANYHPLIVSTGFGIRF